MFFCAEIKEEYTFENRIFSYRQAVDGISACGCAFIAANSVGGVWRFYSLGGWRGKRRDLHVLWNAKSFEGGSSFPFYGKDHNRVGLWPYGITNAGDSGNSAPGYCLEPNKSMRTRTQGTFHSYDLDKDGDNLPLGLTRETAEILWYALSSSGNFEGYQERA